MHDKGVEPDMVSYNTVINALGRCGRVQEAMEYLHRMKEQGLSPDVVTFGTLIHACAQSARKDAALALFAEMVRPRWVVLSCGCVVLWLCCGCAMVVLWLFCAALGWAGSDVHVGDDDNLPMFTITVCSRLFTCVNFPGEPRTEA